MYGKYNLFFNLYQKFRKLPQKVWKDGKSYSPGWSTALPATRMEDQNCAAAKKRVYKLERPLNNFVKE